ncbi:MAG: HEAT repeat domain-containing protein, partial [Myxococcota bacterium]
MDSHPSPTPYVAVPAQVQELQERFLMQPQDEARARILLELGRLSNLIDDDGHYPYREAVARTLVELHNLSVWLPEKRAIIRAMGECRNSEVIFRFLLRTLDVLDMDDVDGPDLVTAVIDAFGRITLPASGPVLLRRYLTEVPEIVRLQAIEVLGHLGFSEAEETIVAALDEGSRAQIVALYALTELVSSAGLERVEEILENAWQTGELEQDQDRELARAALIYLSTLGAPQAEKWVTRLRYTHGPDLRCLSLWGRRLLRQYASDDLLDLITSALEEEDDYTRMFLGRNLRRYDPEEVLETGEVFCETEQGQLRLIKTVSEIGGSVITQWLWERFISIDSDATAPVRATAIRALRQVDELQGRRLLTLAPDADPLVVTAAIRTASNFGPLELYLPLSELLEHDEPIVRQEAVRGIQHLLLAHRPSHVVLRENKGDVRGHRPDDLPLDDEALEVIDAGFRKILRRDDDGMTQGLVAYAAANLRRFDLRPRVIRLAERSQDSFARMAAYHALLDMPDTDQVDRIMEAFAKEKDRLARSACIRTLAPLLASMEKPDGELEEKLIQAIDKAIDDASA